jgi:hypothetical protein
MGTLGRANDVPVVLVTGAPGAGKSTVAAEGYVPVLDDVIVGAEDLTTYEEVLVPSPLLTVLLAPSLAEVLARNGSRTNKGDFDTALLEPVSTRLYTAMLRHNRPENGWLVLDTTHEGSEATAMRVLDRLQRLTAR